MIWLWGEVLGVNKLRIRRPYERFRDASEEARLLNELINIVGNVDSILIIAERHGKTAISLLRTFIYDSLGKLDDFAKKCRSLIGKTTDYVC